MDRSMSVTMLRELWRDWPILGKMAAGTSPAEPVFLCGNPRDLLATSQRPIFTKFSHETEM